MPLRLGLLVLLLLLLLLLFACTSGQLANPPGPPEGRAVELPRFGIRARLPAGWTLLRGPATGPETVLSFLPEADARHAGAPPRVHAHHDVSFVSILPAGFGTELPASQSRRLSSWSGTLELPFRVASKKARVLLLADGAPWAFFLPLAAPPEGWSEDAFIFAQARVRSLRAACFAEGAEREVDPETCDPMVGDRMVLEGEVDDTALAAVRDILASLELGPRRPWGRTMRQVHEPAERPAGPLRP